MITCPSCGETVPDQDRCARCGYPIILRRDERAGPGGDQRSARTAPQPAVPPASAYPLPPAGAYGPTGSYPTPGGYQQPQQPGYQQPPPSGYPQPGYQQPGVQQPGVQSAYQQGQDGTVVCPNAACRHPNPARRTLCEQCGWYLRPQPVPGQQLPPAAAPPPPAPERSRRVPLVLAGIGSVLLVSLIAASWGLLRGGGPDTTATPPASSGSSGSNAAPKTYVVDPGLVSVKASSVQKAVDKVTYVPQNLLDDNPKTAWNSNGDKIGDGKGVVLSFTFSEPVHLRGVAVLNGYQKTVDNNDLYRKNSRVAGLTVKTDSASKDWQLKDQREAQALEADLGETSTVTLTVTDVYPGDDYKDLALSEVSFLAQR